MNKFLTLTSSSVLLLGTLLITGCGGGGSDDGDSGGNIGYTGSTAPASVTDSNAEALGVDATEAAAKAIEADSTDAGALPFGISITDTTSSLQQIQDINQHILESLQVSNLPIGLTLDGSDFPPEIGYCGGSVTVPDSWANAGSELDLDGTITYNNFCFGAGEIFGQMTVNGSITMSNGAVTSYGNLTISLSNGTVISCNGSAGSTTSCTTSNVYTGASGSSYMVTNVSVSGNEFSGYTVDAKYCNASYGCLTIATPSPIVFDCSNGNPSSGIITFTSDNGSNGSITFDSCTSYTITYSTSAGGAVNTISGTW